MVRTHGPCTHRGSNSQPSGTHQGATLQLATELAKQKNKKRILFRYGLVTVVFVGVAIAIVLSLAYTTTVNAADWEKEANEQIGIEKVIAPERGSILACNGSILACNVLVWDVKLDMQHPKMTSSKLNLPGLDSLAEYLDRHYPRPADLRSLPPDSAAKCSWRARLQREMAKPQKKRNRALVIARGVSENTIDTLRRAPFLKDFIKSSSVPLYQLSRSVRRQPYGMMARYSIGVVNEVKILDRITPKGDTIYRHESHGYSGLEKDLDSLLYGKPGKSRSVTFNSGVSGWETVPARRGFDVVTTIDLQIQDILEQEMAERCSAVKAEWGTAMVMEVATGEIKAISNLERRDDGTYGEAYNRTVTCFEPGSVVKPISLLIAFEDGLITSNHNTVDCSPFMKTTDPHAPTVKTIPEVMGWSSNTGVARIIFRGYGDRPEAFYDRWKKLGLLDRMHTGIAEERPAQLRRLTARTPSGLPITMTARHLDLARQAFGYSVEISPLYLLSIYNAIANNGRYVRPHLVRALRGGDGRDSIVRTPPIMEQVCTPDHARMLRECLRQVVTGGTARSAKLDEIVPLAGKTGTCYPVFEKGRGTGYDHSRRRFAFAGFFPYDNPQYSVVVLVLAPAGSGGAGSISGKVLSRVAERMFARGMLGDTPDYQRDPVASSPVLSNGIGQAIPDVRQNLGVSVRRIAAPLPGSQAPRAVPDVRGYDARAALRELETRGINVVLRGAGTVRQQSIAPGTPLRPGQKIFLTLS